MMPEYISFMEIAHVNNANFHFLIPAADSLIKEKIESYIQNKNLPITISIGSARDFLSISKYSIVTSGTATLEAAVLQAAPIICYKTNNFNYFIISRTVSYTHLTLPTKA